MKLRIARKMDLGGWKRRAFDDRDNRHWARVYSVPQLQRAERRLRRSHYTHCKLRRDEVDEHGKVRLYRRLIEDFFRANRVHSRWIRQIELHRWWRATARRKGS